MKQGIQTLFHKRTTHYQYDKLWCGRGNYTIFHYKSLCPYHNNFQGTVIPSYLFLFFFPFVFSSENLVKDVSEFKKVLKHTIIAYFQKSFTVPSIIVLSFVLTRKSFLFDSCQLASYQKVCMLLVMLFLVVKNCGREYKHTI